jgi:DNA-binding CsgD family transcriptional regulator
MDRQADRVRQDIIRLCHAGLDSRRLRTEIVRHLRRVMPVDAAFFATVDPSTLLFTSAVADEMLERATPRFLQNEFLDRDANRFVDLARHRRHVGSLESATGGALQESARYREILRPMGLGDELRAALLVDGTCWGVMCLHREDSRFPYTSAEAAYVARLAPHVAEGLRSALVIGQLTPAPLPTGPGVVLLANDLSLVAVTQAAEAWLSEIDAPDAGKDGELPRAVTAVAARLLALECEGDQAPDLMPRVRARTLSGRWAVLHASRLGGPAGLDHIAVTIEEALPADIAPVVLLGYGLSARETEIAGVVLRGLSTAEIAAALHISLATVQDHLKSIFDKTGVRSRRELVATLFGRHYLPPMKAGLEPSPRGGFRSP